MTSLPLKGLLVLEFSQYLSGPSAGLRLADLGARVIKIERPNGGDPGRKLAIKNLWIGEDALNFHAINRNKESFVANLKNQEDLLLVKKLIEKADVMTHNFRPGVMNKIGLDYKSVKAINKSIIYTEITGYGKEGPWKNKPGQDLLLQSLSGLAYTTGNDGEGPVPFGLSVVDTVCGIHAVQGILAALIRRQKTKQGAYMELSMMESILSFQFELLTTYYHSKNGIKRSAVNNGNPLLGAPYGIYKTKDSYIALAMMDITLLQQALDSEPLKQYSQADVFTKRDEIKTIIDRVLKTNTTGFWLQRLQSLDLWASDVKNWNELQRCNGYTEADMEQMIRTADGRQVTTTRSPMRINGEKLKAAVAAPLLGAHTELIRKEMIK
ncbi:MAG: CaiB/BaiF CoA-transferase family protein [Niabella sp.]